MPSGKVDETSGAMRADRKGLAICKEFTSRGKIVRMDMEGQKNVCSCCLAGSFSRPTDDGKTVRVRLFYFFL
jgi:hypothetical protein